MNEDDTTGDDHFGDKTFEMPVSDIVLDANQGYYEQGGLTVYDGIQYLIVTFRFEPTMRRLE